METQRNTLHFMHITYVLLLRLDLLHLDTCFFHHLWKMDGAIVSQSCIWLQFPLLTWGSVVIFAVTCDSCLGLSNQLFTEEQFEVKELQWFLLQRLAVTLILKPWVGDCQVKKVENCTHCPFPSARSHPVETQHSVNQVQATHAGAVLSSCQWPWHLDKPFAFLGPSSVSALRFSAIGRWCHVNWLVVQPLSDCKFRRALSDNHIWCPSSFVFWRAYPLWSSTPLQPCFSLGFQSQSAPVKEQVGPLGNRLRQMRNTLFFNAPSFCNSEGSLALVDHKV